MVVWFGDRGYNSLVQSKQGKFFWDDTVLDLTTENGNYKGKNILILFYDWLRVVVWQYIYWRFMTF